MHRLMLRDSIRNAAYRDALHATIRPGDVVLDVGAGTGILSMFAVQAGASRVYAVERSTMVTVAKALAKTNGFSDRIIIINDDIENVSPPERVDVIVSEWLGTLGVDENMLAPVVLARDRWLKPDSRMLPERVTSWIAPLWSEELAGELEWLTGRPYGIDFRAVMDRSEAQLFRSWRTLDREAMPIEPKAMWTIDARSIGHSAALQPFRAALRWTPKRHGRVNTLATWFDAQFGSGIVLTNAPTAPRTHWGQFLFPLRRPRDVKRGQAIDVKFACIPSGPGSSRFTWSIRDGGGTWEHGRVG
jgi:protein arginine N-methyltransferase 1